MQQLKPWQIVLFVAALGAIGFIAYRVIRGNGVNINHNLMVVNIANGDLYEIDTNGKGIVLPAKDPDTGKRTLYPIFKDDDGSWKLEGRALNSILAKKVKVGASIDLKTGLLKEQPGKIHKVNAKELVKRRK